VAHELRTTYHPALISDEALFALAHSLAEAGAGDWVLQPWQAHEDPADAAPPTAQLQASWHWPHPTVLDQLRRVGPRLHLR
jgi:pyruvate formate lyase activating enzyme